MPGLNKGPWTEREHQKFLKGVEKFGNSWIRVAEIVGTRSRTQVKDHNRWLPKNSPYKKKLESSSSASLRRRSTSKGSSKKSSAKKSTGNKNKKNRSTSKSKKRSTSDRKKRMSSSSSSEDEEEGRSSATGLLTGELELGLTSPRQRPSRKRNSSRGNKAMSNFELDRREKGGENQGGSSKEVEEKADLTGDYWNMALLILLYTLQGIPMGLTGAVSLVLSANDVSLAQQGMFALVSWPFSLKLLWAPIVDSIFIPKFGRRKTWLVPTQLIIAGTIMYAAPHIEDWMSPDPVSSGVKNVYYLTVVFFLLFLMCATQDICVDGWALTLLQKRNVGYASTANAIGQTLGNSLSYIGWVVIDSYTDISFQTFMYVWGILFGVTTVAVMFLKKEEDVSIEDAPPTYLEAYKEMLQVIKIPLVQQLIIILLTCKIAFAPEALTQVMLVGTVGMPKTDWAFVLMMMTIPSLLVPKLVEKYTAGPRPFDLFMRGVLPRIGLGICSALVFMYAPTSFDETSSINYDSCLNYLPSTMCGLLPLRVWNNAVWYASVLVVAFSLCVLSNAMFVAQMSLFARVSDPRIGGTYMTLLNTVANLGYKWTSQLFLFSVDHTDRYMAGVDECSQWKVESDCGKHFGGAGKAVCGWSILQNNTCTGVEWKATTDKHEGFYATMALFSCIGLIWMTTALKKVKSMQDRPITEWHTHN